MNYIKNDKTGLYEAPTDELRQVVSCADQTKYEGACSIEVVKSIQRKWLVQDGDLIEQATYNGKFVSQDHLVFVEYTGEYADVCCLFPIARFVDKTKEEWRDLPTIHV